MANKKSRKGKAQTTSASSEDVTPQTQQAASAKDQSASAGVLNPIWAKAFTFSLLAVFVLMAVMSFSYGLSGDEVDMNEYGKAIFKYFSTFGADKTVFNMPEMYDRDGVILYYGGFFDFICAIFNKFSPFGEYTTRHILNAWAGFLAIFFSARIVALVSDKRMATIAVWLMFLSPFFLGHAMNNPKDIPLATGYIAGVYFIIRFFERFPSVKWTDYLWVILSIGITINIRVAGILLIPYLFVYVGILYMMKNFSSKGSFKINTYIKPLLIISALGYLTGSLFWPYALQNPLSNPLEALSVMSDFKVNLGQIWEGDKVYSGELPKGYLIKSFFLTNTYALLGGLILFFLFFRSVSKSEKANVIYFVAFTALFPLFYIIYKKSNVYHAWRHVLFIFPSVVVIATLGWQYVNSFAKRAYGKAGVGIALVGLLLLEPVVYTVTTFPNTVAYYNAFAGGVKGAYGNYEMDYYYNSVKQCTDYFIKNELPKVPDGKQVLLLSNANHLTTQYLKGYDKVATDYVRYYERDARDYDYAIFHMALVPLNEIQAESWVPQNAIFVARVKGKPLCILVKKEK
ncbi:MAG: glycosyltransferase family 39 protein [Chitinophagales bacterium]|nr:glycosyltransferase family 39 protein [Chitinophagaceae bacterium]MCB9064430.1 glycosyltransferase family 39 protein [Chitinophagales bacterium]